MEIPPKDAIVEVEPTGSTRLLTDRERIAYEFVLARRQSYRPLSPDTQAKMFNLYVEGVDCVEIARLNPGIVLGQIVMARVDGDWDLKRQDLIENALRGVQLRIQQTTLEGIDFMTSILQATHKLHGDAAKKFLQTGDPQDLGNFGVHGPRAYKEILDILKILTGKDGKSEQKHTGEVLHRHEVHSVPAVNRAMTTGEARSAVKEALVIRKKEREG